MIPATPHRRLAPAAAAATALAAALTLGACSSPDDVEAEGAATEETVGARTPEEIKEDGTIKIGSFSDKSPFGYVDENGEFAGYDIEFGERIAEELGVELEWVPVAAQSRVEFLESGKVDIILANFTVTDERKEKVDFAGPYMTVSFGAVSPADAPVEEDDLDDASIVIVKGTTQDAWIEENQPDWDVTKYEQYNEVTSALRDGRGDVWITDNTEALAFTADTDEFVTSIPNFGEESSIAPAVAKGNDALRDWLDELLLKLGEEEFFHEAFEKTLAPVYGDVVEPEDLVVEGGQSSDVY